MGDEPTVHVFAHEGTEYSIQVIPDTLATYSHPILAVCIGILIITGPMTSWE